MRDQQQKVNKVERRELTVISIGLLQETSHLGHLSAL